MKLISYRHRGRETWGAVVDDDVLDLAASSGSATLADFIASDGYARRDELLNQSKIVARLDEVGLLPVIPRPEKIVCVQRNYLEHHREVVAVGLDQLIVDLSLPGVTVRPIRDLSGDSHFDEVFFDNVMLPDDALIGAEGDGWKQVNAELAFERSGPERIYSSIALLEYWLQCLRESDRAATHAGTIGRFAVHLATLRRMSITVTAKLAAGESPIVEAALVKDIGTGFEQELPALLEAAIACDDALAWDEDLMATLAYLSQMAPSFSLRGGTREILRGMIARGLGLR